MTHIERGAVYRHMGATLILKEPVQLAWRGTMNVLRLLGWDSRVAISLRPIRG